MKDSFYLKHDLHSREDRKFSKLIREHGYRAYGLAWAVIERIYEEDGRLPDDEAQLIYELRLNPAMDTPEQLRAVLASDLFYRRDGLIGSESADRRIAERDDISRARSVAGAKGGKSKAIANQVPSQEGRKEGEEGKDRNTAPAAVDHLIGKAVGAVTARSEEVRLSDYRLPFDYGGIAKGVRIQDLDPRCCQDILDKMPRLGDELRAMLKARIAQKKTEARR